jgi:hypothetical protein
MQRMKSKIYIFHDWDPLIDTHDGIIIPLFPHVAFELDKLGIEYQLFEDFISMADLYPQVESHYAAVQEWIVQLGKLTQEHIQSTNIDIVETIRLHVSIIKYVIDEILLESRMVTAFINHIKAPTSIMYIKDRESQETSQDPLNFFRNEASNWIYELLESKLKGHTFIDLSLELIQVGLSSDSPGRPKSIGNRLKSWVRRRVAIVYKSIRSLRSLFVLKKWKKNAVVKDRILTLHGGSLHIDPIIDQCRQDGKGIYQLRDGELFYERDWLEKTLMLLNKHKAKKDHANLYQEFQKAHKSIVQNEDLRAAFESMCGPHTYQVALPYISQIMTETIPTVLAYAHEWLDYLSKHKYDVAIFTNSMEAYGRSFLLANSLLEENRVKTVCVQHGISSYRDPLWFDTDIRPFDAYVASHALTKGIYDAQSKARDDTHCRIVLSNHYFGKIQESGSKRSPASINRILYVPTKIHSYLMSLTVPNYMMLHYFEYQKALVDFFGENENKQFIYKEAISTRSMSYKSIIPYIKSKGYTNIEVGTQRVGEYFNQVDAVIVDRPLTAAFEISASGLPFICLTPSYLAEGLSNLAKQKYKENYCYFDSIPNALKLIHAFIQTDHPEHYQKQEQFDSTWHAMLDEPNNPISTYSRMAKLQRK